MIEQNLKKKRNAKGITQKAVAEKLGIAESAYRQYELGNVEPKVKIAKKIAKLLDTTVEELY